MARHSRDAHTQTKAVLSKLLTQRHLRVTEVRLSILKTLAQARQPLSADELLSRMGRGDRVTLFRNLKELSRHGIIYQTDFHTGRALYEFQDRGAAHHHHLICTDCGLVEETSECVTAPVHSRVLQGSPSFARIESHALEFFGTCRKCESKIQKR